MEKKGNETPISQIFTPKQNSMERKLKGLKFLALFVVISFSSPSFANKFDEGLEAIHGTDYEKALEILMPLAVKGHAPSQYILGVMNGISIICHAI